MAESELSRPILVKEKYPLEARMKDEKKFAWQGGYKLNWMDGGKHYWILAAFTVASALALWGRLKKIATRFFVHFMNNEDNKDKIGRIMNEALVNVSMALQPRIRPIVDEIRKSKERGELSFVDQGELEKYVRKLIDDKFGESVAIIDTELEKIIPKVRQMVLSKLRDEFIVFLFSEGYLK